MEDRQRGKSEVVVDPSSLHQGPCFYKVIFEQVGSLLKLRIPPDFMKNNGSKLRRLNHVNLVGPRGKQKVSLHHEDEDSSGDTYFHEEGWGEFRMTHSLREFEVLIFKYDGKKTFNVTIFDSCGIMRAYDEVESLERTMPCPQSHGEKNVPRSTGIRHGIAGKNTIGTSRGEKYKLKKNDNPFLTICLKDSNVNRLFRLQIPKSFSQYFPDDERRARMVLKNSEGEEWLVNAVKIDRNWAFSAGGWKAFAMDNKLKEGDTCTFELVGKNMVHVHLYRCG